MICLTQSTLTKIVTRALADFEFFASNCVVIRTKSRAVAPLRLNKVQKTLVKAINRQVLNNNPVRIIVLKARQMGISTVIQAYILWRMLREPNTVALEIAHEREAARRILDINRFAVKNLPQWFRQALGVKEEYFTKYEISFANNGSSLEISSAESSNPGRSRTVHLAHLSEHAFYPDPDALTEALFAAIPDTPNTAVFIESTSNGPAGDFYDKYQRAKKGLNDYIPLFFPWYEHDEYRKPVPAGIDVPTPPGYEKLPVTKEQLYWRQWKIDNDYSGDEDKFKREYPHDEASAWIMNSSCAFPVEALSKRISEVSEMCFDEGVITDGKFIAVAGERLHIFKWPQPGRLYVIGADVGSGVAVKDGDPSSADVLDAITGEQVAHLHIIEEPQAFAQDLYQLGHFYNEALISVEVTGGHGLATAIALRNMGYMKLYQRRVYDKLSGGFVNKLGWSTTKTTRRLMINSLRAAFSNGEITINELGTLQEMLTFVKEPDKDDYKAAPGAHDDRVISIAIGNMVRKDVYEYATAVEKQQAQAVLEENRPLEEAPAAGLRRLFRERALRGEEHPELGVYV